MPFQIARRALLDTARTQQWGTVDSVAVYREADAKHGQHVEVQRRCDANTPDAMLAEIAQAAGDRTADVYAAIAARFIAEGAPVEGIALNVDDILRDRGVAPITRPSDHSPHGFRTEDRIAVGKDFEELQRWHLSGRLTSWQPGGKKRKPLSISSALLAVTDTLYQTTAEGEHVPLAIRAVLGEYARHFLASGAGRQVAMLMRQALHYDPYHEQVEKRLAYHLAFYWRQAAHDRSYDQPLLLSKLFRDARIETEGATQRKNAARTIRRWRQALDTLRKDGVLTAYELLPNADDSPKGKLDRWLHQRIRLAPPPWLPEHYHELSKRNPRLRVAGDQTAAQR
jgi:hypothetical protein